MRSGSTSCCGSETTHHGSGPPTSGGGPACHRFGDAARVAATLGLTRPEGRVAALLAEGLRARRIAAATGWRENCVRRLVQRVYRKRGVSGQAALVRQVLAADALPRR